MLSLVESAAKKEDEKVNQKLAKKVYTLPMLLSIAMLIQYQRTRH